MEKSIRMWIVALQYTHPQQVSPFFQFLTIQCFVRHYTLCQTTYSTRVPYIFFFTWYFSNHCSMWRHKQFQRRNKFSQKTNALLILRTQSSRRLETTKQRNIIKFRNKLEEKRKTIDFVHFIIIGNWTGMCSWNSIAVLWCAEFWRTVLSYAVYCKFI